MKYLTTTVTAATLLLAACGGDTDADVEAQTFDERTTTAYADAAPGEANDLVAERTARALAGPHITREQARGLEDSLGGRVMLVTP